ncbi:MAG: glycosyltransferase [Erysipelotrichaceae bacterium]|nr:glycosyltransferase [Erysipelotrichaceae bacterium]
MNIQTVFRILFWCGWLMIPWCAEMVYTLADLFRQLIQSRKNEGKNPHSLTEYPALSIIIQLHSAPESLISCIDSIDKSLYPDQKIRLLIVGDQTAPLSQEVFDLACLSYPSLTIQWVDSRQGFNRAVNTAIYNAPGKYILSLDSRGTLNPQALRYIVSEFEADADKQCICGTVVTKPRVIQRTRKNALRTLQILEFINSIHDAIGSPDAITTRASLYASARRIMAFRKTAIIATQNMETADADFDNIEYIQALLESFDKIHLCKDAIMYVNPVRGWKEVCLKMKNWQLEIQQREWLRTRFRLSGAPLSFTIRRAVLCDNLHALPKLIWILSVFALMICAGQGILIPADALLLYGLYVILEFLRFILVRIQISSLPEISRYYLSKRRMIFLAPAYAMMCAVLSLAGLMINIQRVPDGTMQNSLPEQSVLAVIKNDLRAAGLSMENRKRKDKDRTVYE